MATRRAEGETGFDIVTPGEASYIVESMVKERRLSRADLNRYRKQMLEEVERLTERLKELSAGQIAAGVAGVAAAVALPFAAKAVAKAAGKRGARKILRRATAAVVAGRQLQGRYIATVRRFPKNRREEFSKMAKEQGREAAIKAMLAELGGSDARNSTGIAKRSRKGPRKAKAK